MWNGPAAVTMSENWTGINSLQVSFCCAADALDGGRCRSYSRDDSRASFSKHFERESRVFLSGVATEQSGDKSPNKGGEQSKGLEAVSLRFSGDVTGGYTGGVE